MEVLRSLIVERTRGGIGVGQSWVLDVYYYLIGHGARPEQAMQAMNAFVEEAIEARVHDRPTVDH
jgi:hypothetical protein